VNPEEELPMAWVEVQKDDGGDDILFICGELDLASVQRVRQEVDTAMVTSRTFLALDLGQLTFMDSSGIALLVQLANRLDQVEVRNPSPVVRRVLEVTGLAGTFGLN
jgi:anti-sigma B factor antagonist